MAEHGTRTMYVHYGCRCDACREAEHRQYLKRTETQVRRRNKQLKDEQLDIVVNEYLNGCSQVELAKKYGVGQTTISAWLRKRGCPTNNNEALHKAAVEKCLKEFGTDYETDKTRRYLRTRVRKHDQGITWRVVAKSNGSLKCEICGEECDPNDKTWGTAGPLHPSVDHIVRLCDGGTDTWDNVRLTCLHCNIKENAKMNLKRGA